MNVVETPQTRCRAAIARCDITPPIGCYHRMWGAATHDRSTGVHKPLLATLLWLEPPQGDASQALLIVALDHCLLDSYDISRLQLGAARAADVAPAQAVITFSHTHAAGFLSRSRHEYAGGDLIPPYLSELDDKVKNLAGRIRDAVVPATIVYGTGRSRLAAHRDFYDSKGARFVCGLNPAGPADDTLLIGKISAGRGQLLATVVNYACHPTTLAWENTLVSPDYVGALRETVEQHTHAPCLFLQGASGDLGPRHGFVGDTAVADSNGRQLAFAALAAVEALPPSGTQFVYSGRVESGATLGVWRHEPVSAASRSGHGLWEFAQVEIPLEYRPELPSKEATEAELERWQNEGHRADAAGDREQAAASHAHIERMTRQLWKLTELPGGRFLLVATVARMGNAVWVFVPGEHYQVLQTELRARFPNCPLLVTTVSNGWQPGYIPTSDTYGRGIYQEQIAVVAKGSAEQVIAAVAAEIERLLNRLVGESE
jgi:hypothetical protein